MLPEDAFEKAPYLQAFLQKVSKTYATFERDRALSEHAYTVSEQEYQLLNDKLKEQSTRREEYVRQLRTALAVLQDQVYTHADANALEEDTNLSVLIAKLQERISLTKKLEQELIAARILAEQGARAKSEFLSVMSHEIRTPLNAITGLAHLMRFENEPEEQAQYLKMLTQSCESLLGLVSEVLDLSKLEEKKLHLKLRPFSLTTLVQSLVQGHLANAQNNGLFLTTNIDESLPALVLGDDYRLQQILNNLISNALKFTTTGGVTLDVYPTQSQDGGEPALVTFSVQDTGIGMSLAEQSHIFERFTQANADTTRTYGGSGLGLAIVRQLVELHGGTIQLESTVGIGSRFYFTLLLPTAEVPAKQQIRTSTPTLPRLDGFHILLAEDLALNVLVAKRLLERQGARVEVANNGQEATEMASLSNFNIILMDLQMPHMDGFEATKRIHEQGIHTPIIALSADTNPATHALTRDAGMVGVVAKPFNPEHLIRQILEFAQAQ
jgi:signal transduction histidine kinase